MRKTKKIFMRITESQKVRLFDTVSKLNEISSEHNSKISVSAFLEQAIERAIKQAQRKVREIE